MGSVGSNIVYYEKPVLNTPLIYGMAAIRKGSVDIDGYSNKKTLKGAIKDLAKAVDTFDKGEGDYLRGLVKDNELSMVKPDKTIGANQYILEWENVPSASRFNEDKDEMEYKDANYYLHIRFLK